MKSRLERKVDNLIAMVASFITNVSKDKETSKYDIDANRKNTANAQKTADEANEAWRENSETIVDTQNGLVEAYEAAETNADSIIDIENAIVEIYEMITGDEESEVE